MSKTDIVTPVITANDLIALLMRLKAQTKSGDADVSIILDEKCLIVSEVCWNDMGDEIQIKVFES